MAKVQALIRIRPLSAEEKRNQMKKGWTKIGDRGIIQYLGGDGSEISSQAMFFDWVFGEQETNADVYAHMASSIEQALLGINVCVIAYGQTSSGKTHTMRGYLVQDQLSAWLPADKENKRVRSDSDPGIIPRALQALYQKKTNQQISISFIEVYNECIYDLLGDSTENLQIREGVSGEVYIQNVTEKEAKTVQEALQIFLTGDKSRKVAATRMNRESSRSHALLKIKIKVSGQTTSAVFVDLAGSERHKLAQTEGKSLKEGACINKSLLALTTVISKLSLKQTHIPFRDAKLTRILQPSLTEGSLTLLICAVSPIPKCTEETLSTLNLASRAKNIDIKPAPKPPKTSITTRIHRLINSTQSLRSSITQAKEDLTATKTLLDTAEEDIQFLTTALAHPPPSFSNPLPPPPSKPLSTAHPAHAQANLAELLAELKHTKAKHLTRLSELSDSVQYLLKQEKYFSAAIKPPPPTATLLQHLVEGDKLIQQQREQIKTLLQQTNSTQSNPTQTSTTHPNLTFALEIDRLKKDFQREKRILQLKIAQLESQHNSTN
ncbi:hypothetical protein NEHOM01_0248 [Nematocida homosporus]|uniref:uncharacterized protein n=1 Tax=Nematocida homosporus TaxID=1912981 RepID=UPI00221E479E|nr:uncharacterized protein NEHOM01_0248 [Nematocida homosporus]KAI5184573.1 hypothetical protein NEHOM01_0248 [Nematocida homosporus]